MAAATPVEPRHGFFVSVIVPVLVPLWFALFGIWPLAHPQHDTYSDLLTLLDLALHAGGVLVLAKPGRRTRERARLAWFVYRHGLPITAEFADGTRYEWKPADQ